MYYSVQGTFHCQHVNRITFLKLKTKYNLDEDIILDYTLQDNVRTSTRDWIGIFPRGWSNLQQYLTFEYTVAPPKSMSSLNRSLLFSHTFHQEASPSVDYQFVYVSKEIEILGTSSYFRFIIPPNHRADLANQNAHRPEYVIATGGGYPPTIVSSLDNDTRKSPIVVTNEASETIANVIARPFCGANFSSYVDHRQRICRFCCSTKSSPTVTANRVQFLLTYNNKLVARMTRLERDLALAETAVKHEKMARNGLTKRLEAYEAFVTEMFKSLDIKGTVKVTDKMGKEIIIRKLLPKELASIHREQSNKCVPITQISILNQCKENRAEENTLGSARFRESFEKFEKLPHSSVGDEGIKEKLEFPNLKRDISEWVSVRNTIERSKRSSSVSLSVEKHLPEHDKENSRATLSAVECTADCRNGSHRRTIEEIADIEKKDETDVMKDNYPIEKSNDIKRKAIDENNDEEFNKKINFSEKINSNDDNERKSFNENDETSAENVCEDVKKNSEIDLIKDSHEIEKLNDNKYNINEIKRREMNENELKDIPCFVEENNFNSNCDPDNLNVMQKDKISSDSAQEGRKNSEIDVTKDPEIKKSNDVTYNTKELTKKEIIDEVLKDTVDLPEGMNCNGDRDRSNLKDTENNKESSENARKEWVIECECDLEVSNQLYEEISTDEKNFTDHGRILSNEMREMSEEKPQSKPSAILIKGRNAKFAIIRY